jgi:hypothetical protein
MDKKRFAWIIKAIDFEKLNDWETKFLGDLERRMKTKGDLTESQEEILERIFEQKQ